jgi:thiol-disulfide isomerase/thioredoxin
MFRLAVCVLVLGTGCKKDHPAATPDACAKSVAEGPLGWIADDYPAAIACGKQKHVPVVLDLWAPWCHTCLSMQTTVFLDPSFGKDNARFVFAKLDTDREQNSAPLEKLAIAAWPTFYVIDSANDAVLGRWVGTRAQRRRRCSDLAHAERRSRARSERSRDRRDRAHRGVSRRTADVVAARGALELDHHDQAQAR